MSEPSLPIMMLYRLLGRDHLIYEVIHSKENFMPSDECEDLMSEDLSLENTEDLSCFHPFDRFWGGRESSI